MIDLSPYSPFITGAIGIFTGLFFERFKNRTLVLTYTINYQPLATTLKNDFWGNTVVFHNGREINHLSFVTIEIKNSTAIDAQGPLVLEAWFNDASQFLGHRGFYDTGEYVPFEQNFNTGYSQTITNLNEDKLKREQDNYYISPVTLDSEVKYYLSNRKLSLPIFNRKSSVTINFLVENIEGLIPKIYLNIQQKGLKLIPQGDTEKIENTKKIIVGSATLISYIFGLVWLFKHYVGKSDAIISTVLIGTITYFIGHVTYYLYQFLKKSFWR